MTVVERPRSLAEALDLRARHADAVAIAGGTDVMVEVNAGRRRPERLIDLTGVPELLDWERRDGAVRLGAGVPYVRLIAELAGQLPGLAHAARIVGSPQIRNRGTVGGSLATASPAGDALPPLVAVDAVIEAASERGARTIAIGDFLLGPKRTSLAPDELVVAVDIPAARGPQVFSRIGCRTAVTTSIASFALDLDPSGRVGAAIGATGPTVLRAPAAESFLAGALAAGAVDEQVAARFGELCGAATEPVDDLRATADYRRRAISVLARRAVTWAMAEIDEADVKVSLTVNGAPCEAETADAGESLLTLLRERLGLRGTKRSCEEGQCGACSVYLDGVLVNTCLVAAGQAEGCRVVTIEGLAQEGGIDPVQAAFIEAGAVQCGFCTPGLVMAAHDLLERVPMPSDGAIREALAGNLCRCTGYEKILDAVRIASARKPIT